MNSEFVKQRINKLKEIVDNFTEVCRYNKWDCNFMFLNIILDGDDSYESRYDLDNMIVYDSLYDIAMTIKDISTISIMLTSWDGIGEITDRDTSIQIVMNNVFDVLNVFICIDGVDSPYAELKAPYLRELLTGNHKPWHQYKIDVSEHLFDNSYRTYYRLLLEDIPYYMNNKYLLP